VGLRICLPMRIRVAWRCLWRMLPGYWRTLVPPVVGALVVDGFEGAEEDSAGESDDPVGDSGDTTAAVACISTARFMGWL